MRTVFLLAALLTTALANAAGLPLKPLALPAWVDGAATGTIGDGRPDLRARRAGLRHLDNGRYSAALRSFKEASLFADKASQALVALMLSAGLGVERDPVTGLAWMELAAERGYPVLLNERARLANAMDHGQRARAATIAGTLQGEHGDVVAKKRLADAMSMRLLPAGESRVTGSRVGNTSGIRNGSPNAEGKMVLDVGGGLHRRDVVEPHRWNADRYWAAQDRLWSNLRDNG